MDYLWKACSKKRGPTICQNILLPETTLWFSFPEKRLLILQSWLAQKFLWPLKSLLDSSFLVFKNLFLSFGLFIIAFLSFLVIKLRFSERIYFIFVFGACLSRTDNTVSLNFDSGAFVISNFNNSFFLSLGESCHSQNSLFSEFWV